MEGLPSEKTAVERLGQALKERESFLAQLKAKTKAFVDNLKAEKAALEATLESQAQALDELSAERDALKQKVKELEQASSSSASSTNDSGGDASQQGGDQQALQKELEALKVGEAAALAELQREKAAVRQRAEELSLAKQQNAELMTQLTEAARHEKAAKALEGELEGARRRASNLAEEMALAKQQNQALLRDLDGRMQAEVGEREEALAAVKAELGRCKQAQGAAEDRAAALEKELEGARAELVQAQEALVGEKAEADRLEGEVEALRAEMAAPQRERKASEEDGEGELVEDLQRQVEALRLELSTAHARQQALHEQLTAAKQQQQQQRPATPKKGEAATEHPLADLTPLQAASAPAPARASPGPVPAVPGGDLIDLGGLNDPMLPPPTQAVSTSLAVSVEAAGATEVATLRERVAELERELEGHRRRASSVTEAEEAQRDMALELGALEAKLAAQQGGEQELRATVAQREARVVDLEKEVQGLRAAVQVGDTGRDEELATLRGGLEGEQRAHAVARQALEELTGRVETLQAELGQARRELLEKGSQLLAVGKDADERRAEEAKAEEVLRDTKRTLEERMVVLRREADGARAELEGARKELADVREQLRALQEEKGSLGEAARLAAADQAQAAEAREALRGERDALREELATKSAALESLREAHEKQGGELSALREKQQDHEDQLASQRHEADEAVRRIKADAETEVASARFQLGEAQQAKTMMEKAVAAMNLQVEGLKRSLGQLSGDREQLQQERGKLAAELSAERESGHERRRQMRAYLEAVTKEKADLEGKLAALNGDLGAAHGREAEARQQMEASETRVAELQAQLRQREGDMQAALGERDQEIARLRSEQAVRLDTTVRRSEEMAHNLLAAEAETAAHKAKRLAAKNEMITLAQTLEELSVVARSVEQTMQVTLVPRALEQVALLEQAVMQVEDAARTLSKPGALARLRERRTMGLEMRSMAPSANRMRSPSEDRLIPQRSDSFEDSRGGPEAKMGNGGRHGGNEEEEEEDDRSRSSSGHKAKPLPLTTERVDRLVQEMSRVSAGLHLLNHSLDKLQDAVVVSQQGSCARLVYDCMTIVRPTPVRQPYSRVLQSDESIADDQRSPAGDAV